MTSTRHVRSLTLVATVVCLGACATTQRPTSDYDPDLKFAQMAPAQPMEITGSRIKRMVSADDMSPPTHTPVSVIPREAMERHGDFSVYDTLLRAVPNMVRQAPGL